MKKSNKKGYLLLIAAICMMLLGSGCLSTATVAAPTTYTIKYNANGGKGKMQSQTCKSGKKIKLKKNKFKRKGYTFVKWTTKKNGSGKSYKDKAKVKNLTKNNSITLYAQWGKNYTVKFNANGGTVAQTSKTVFPRNIMSNESNEDEIGMQCMTATGMTATGMTAQDMILNDVSSHLKDE